ncbi:MAG: AAA family ATPase [Chloroflexi bacterium]|nr:AAA family ATPase [Chloroflexota bacterium]
MTAPVTPPLPTLPVHALPQRPTSAPWLVQQLWGAAAVGVIGGVPKVAKSWLGLELAVSVASGTACLGRFPVDTPGPVVVYLAEDGLPAVRDRIDQLCQHRGLTLARLDPLRVITAPSLRLDLQSDRQALDQTLAALRPKLLLLDPLVRLHRLDENSAADISGLLGFLRELNRRHDVAIILVHHMAKRARQDLGQALRGSSDLYAWIDSGCYLVRHHEQLRLTVQHRAAPAPEPMLLRLAGGHGEPCRLELDGLDAEPPPLAEAVRAHLRQAGMPCSRATLRRQLRVNNARLGEALGALQVRGLVLRGPAGWFLPAAADPQLSLPC